MFKALVIAYYFPPMGLSGVQRTLKFSKYMSNFNWHPTIITGSGSSYFAYDMSLLRESEESDIRVIRTEPFDPRSIIQKRGKLVNFNEKIKNKVNQATKNLFIPDNKIFWAAKAYKKAKEILQQEEFDVIYVSCPPFSAFKMAAKLKHEFDIPLFVDYRDIWWNTSGSTPYHSFKNHKIEDSSLRAADRVIVVNRKIKEKLLMKYPFLTFEDIIIIPNGFDREDFYNLKPVKYDKQKMKITYSGIFNDAASPKFFLEAFKKLTIERPDVAADIELHFIGRLRTKNRKLINSLGLQKYVFDHGSMDHKESLRYISASDVLWMMVDNVKNAYTVTGGKLYEYFGTGKPIIACVPIDGAASHAAQEYGASFIVEPDNVENIKNTIGKVYSLYKEDKLPTANTDFIDKLDRVSLTEQLTTEFQFFIKEI